MSEPDVASLRARILADPGIILDDVELMRAIVQAERRGFGRQVVDLRGVLVERLEERLDRLEDTHREVLAAAYDNVAGTAQIHRACLMLLGAEDFAGFLHALTNDVQNTLHVDLVRLALEAPAAEPGSGLGPGALKEAVVALPSGGAETYVTAGRGGPVRPVVLRGLSRASPTVYGEAAPEIRSEAAILLDLGTGRLPGILALGSHEEDRFDPEQGIDLLTFFGGVVERALRRFLA
ncbi:MAG TPA: DUF484 family protein [Paracoccaceae bacterium]|nr:DUF484 family protein [Paracoccaceae bacterium]